jgi:hypothetical protein
MSARKITAIVYVSINRSGYFPTLYDWPRKNGLSAACTLYFHGFIRHNAARFSRRQSGPRLAFADGKLCNECS